MCFCGIGTEDCAKSLDTILCYDALQHVAAWCSSYSCRCSATQSSNQVRLCPCSPAGLEHICCAHAVSSHHSNELHMHPVCAGHLPGSNPTARARGTSHSGQPHHSCGQTILVLLGDMSQQPQRLRQRQQRESAAQHRWQQPCYQTQAACWSAWACASLQRHSQRLSSSPSQRCWCAVCTCVPHLSAVVLDSCPRSKLWPHQGFCTLPHGDGGTIPAQSHSIAGRGMALASLSAAYKLTLNSAAIDGACTVAVSCAQQSLMAGALLTCAHATVRRGGGRRRRSSSWPVSPQRRCLTQQRPCGCPAWRSQRPSRRCHCSGETCSHLTGQCFDNAACIQCCFAAAGIPGRHC